MAAVEALLSADGGSGDFCHGDSPSLADVVLVPQIYVAINRFGVDCDSRFPTASAIYGHCMAMPQFREAAPDRVKEVA
jgi:maleylpyruvate isomerase